MIRVKSYAPMALSLAFAALLCVLLTPQIETFATEMPVFFGRAVGIGLLGFAGLAIVLVFRSLPVAPVPVRARTIRRESEFRRGFAKGRSAANRMRIEPRIDQRGEVVALRCRAKAAPSTVAVAAPRNSHEDIEIVQRRLQDRAEVLWRRRAG
jgi:hypothetical protein